MDNKLIQLDLNDTSGKHDVKLRSLSFSQTDIFMIAFSVSSPKSFENISTKWIKEISGTQDREGNQIPFVLIGCKSDERADAEEVVSESEINDFVRQNAWCLNYKETSALTQQGIKEAFDCVINRVLHPPNSQQANCQCTIL